MKSVNSADGHEWVFMGGSQNSIRQEVELACFGSDIVTRP